MGKNGYRCITFAQIQVCPNRTQMSSKLHPRFNTSQWPIPFLFELFILNENEHDRFQNKLRVKRDDRHPHNIDENNTKPNGTNNLFMLSFIHRSFKKVFLRLALANSHEVLLEPPSLVCGVNSRPQRGPIQHDILAWARSI